MYMVEVFKTNVENYSAAERLLNLLKYNFPEAKINFDLEDCDRILRFESVSVCIEKIQALVTAEGFFAEVL